MRVSTAVWCVMACMMVVGCGVPQERVATSSNSINSEVSPNAINETVNTNTTTNNTTSDTTTTNVVISNATSQGNSITSTNQVSSPSVTQATRPKPPANNIAYLGQTVHVGVFTLEVPDSVKTPIMRTSDNNVFVYGSNPYYIFIEMDVTNDSNQTQPIGANMFNLTWTPQGGSTELYRGDYAQEVNMNTSTHSLSGSYYYASPDDHNIAPGATERLDLIYLMPRDVSPNEAGTFGLQAMLQYGHEQRFELSQLG